MNLTLSEAVETYSFNEAFLDSILGETFFEPAFEAEDAATNTNNTNTDPKPNNGNTLDNTANTKGDAEQSPEDKKKTEGILAKIKEVFNALVDMVTQAITTFKSKLTYLFNMKKDFEKEMRTLEKGHKPRFGIVKKNRRYDYTFAFLNNVISTYDKLYNEYTTDLSNVTKGLQDVLGGRSQAEDFNNTVNSVSEKEIHKNAAKYFASSLGPEFNKVENFGGLTKAIQCKQQGKKISTDENDNGGGDSVEMTIDQPMYNNARQCIRIAETNIKRVNQSIDRVNSDVKKWKGSLQLTNNSAAKGDTYKSMSKISKLGKGLNFYVSLVNFIAACYIETVTNARLVCKACLTGGN